MATPGTGRFAEFFGALWGYDPFPWQAALAERVGGATGASGWPQVLALPTASGKTACLDIAVFALASQAARAAADRTAPRRIFFVVDRRVIVDEAFERAKEIAARLREARGGVLGSVADALRRVADLDADERPLACFALRGGLYRDDAWARTPTQPTIVTSTVDQVGSRLLFRGYGGSAKSWPLHAGLAAHDALLLLDEAHCSAAFSETLASVDAYRDERWAERPLRSPFAFVEMTATPRPGRQVVGLENADREHPTLRLRLEARKPVRLAGPLNSRVGSAVHVRELCREAEALAVAGARRVAVMVNRVATARRVFETLAVDAERKVLMTGRMRPLDRDDLMRLWGPRLAAKSGREQPERPWFVVATQCLEVGANLDFDAMVSECASLDALRQRFGRLNRLGLDEAAAGVVVVARESLKGEDFVYGDALAATWEWLSGQAEEQGDKLVVDFGIDALDRRWRGAVEDDPSLASRLLAPAPSAPVLLPAHLDAWAQTSPAPMPSPDLGVFLHGPDRDRPEVMLCWRGDLAPGREEGRDEARRAWIDLLTLCPPAAAECLQAPLAAVRRWLQGEGGEGEVEVADVEAGRSSEEEEASGDPVRRPILRWRGGDATRSLWLERLSDLRPGDTLVLAVEPHERIWLDREARGDAFLSDEERRLLRQSPTPAWAHFGHLPGTPGQPPILDRGDEAFVLARDRAALRVHRHTVDAWPESEAKTALLALAEQPELEEGLTDRELRETVKSRLRALAEEPRCPEWLRAAASHLASRRLSIRRHPRSARRAGAGLILTAPGRLHRGASSETFGREDDAPVVQAPVPLDEHLQGVAELARRFGNAGTLPAEVISDLELAGRLHDLGKADQRFQAWLHRGNELAARAARRLLAKSPGLPQTPSERERARERSGYPKGGRHELVSVRLIESAPETLALAHDPDLVLHLVASHHGHGRPFAPAVVDQPPIVVRCSSGGLTLAAESDTGLERVDSGVPKRFWRLVRRYGWWGLAYLEAVFVLADRRRSEQEESAESEDGEMLERGTA
jgi:CRISPR-associated endonuclease/helicase Cas3